MNINSSLQKTPIAVIGISSIFADAKNVEEFWTNIVQGKDSITDVPENRWRIEDYYDEDMSAPDKTYCKRGGFLPEIEFNPMEFGLPPNILEVTDASQLLALVAARDAFEDAGYGKNSEKFTKEVKEKTGVLLGVGGGQKLITPLIARLQYPIWEKALRASGIPEESIPDIVDKMKKAYVGWNENSFPGLLGNVISGRITNRFDLGGINSVVDAACAASLSAIKMSLSELVEGRCDMMLTGGVDTDNSPFMYMSFSKTPAFSKSGNISPFSDAADGMLIGEGIGMIVLKRLADAERDGDNIYAVIKGVGTSSDGRFKSVYAPRPYGQALAMNRAYEDAGYAPSTVGLLEAHGTGTGAGDPTEFTSMQMVFGADNPKKQHIALGSVKSQIGHTKAAAGAAGIVKAVLSLHHKVLPPTINVDQPNSKFDIEESAIYINTEARPWIKGDHPRRAGVSAFGFGGINVHLTLEEYTGKMPITYRLHQPYKSVLIKADSPALLLEDCKAYLSQLNGPDGEDSFKEILASSQNIKLNRKDARLGFVVQSKDECIDMFDTTIKTLEGNSEQWNHPKGIYYGPSGIDIDQSKIVALFSGQGSQYVGMGRELANAFPEVAQAYAQADDLFNAKGITTLADTIFPIPSFSKKLKQAQEKSLTQTQYAQPAIGAFSMGQYKVLHKAGLKPHFTAGHSFGELTALWAAGVYNEKTFLSLAKTRGAAMAKDNPTADTGAMLAVKASAEAVQKAIAQIEGVIIANVNSPTQVVLGGSTVAIKKAEQELSNNGFSVVALPVSAAFHTEFVKHAQVPFSTFVGKQKMSIPKIPVYSNTTGIAYPESVASIKSILKNQILNPVLFKDQIENIYADGGRIFIEFGPKGVLTNLVKNILHDKEYTALAVNPKANADSDLQLRQAMIQLGVLGVPMNIADPYKKELAPLPESTKLNVSISGNNYVSKATQKKYTDVLNNGIKVPMGEVQVIEKIIEVEKIVTLENNHNAQISPVQHSQIENEEEMINKEVLQLLQSTLESFKSNQTKSLEIFERFLSDQNQQSQQLLTLLSNQMSGTGSDGSGAKSLMASAPIAPVVQPIKVVAEPNVQVVTPKAPIVLKEVAPASPIQSTPSNTNSLEKILLEVISEKTGYPAEMLELSMDMEADLGIDSIKRVEIFGALTAQYPEMSNIHPNELTELRTLGEIVDFVSQSSSTISAPTNGHVATPSSVEAPVVQAPVETQKSSQTSGSADQAKLQEILLEVVSEKTGYPAEMLELEMDMEADLGIDSIKRVEIFGALTAQYPEMSNINPNELTELRTLGEIVSFVFQNGSGTVENIPAPVPATSEVKAEPKIVSEAPSNGSVGNDKLKDILLEVVSEKTGYPAEMLELEMDMEADLGIDSIKRVEIFGALTAQYPEMSDINPNELTELRTLGEIVDFVGSAAAKK